MKLELCLLACDLNKDYTQFFKIVMYSWSKFVGIKTKFILISSHIPEELEPFKENITLFEPINEIPTAFQAQCIRLLYPALLTEIKDSIIISDMDLIPLNENFYIDTIKNVPGDNFIVYRNVISTFSQYPICFCAANPNTWKQIFNINSEIDIRDSIKSWYNTFLNAGHFYQISSPFSVIWACDQIKLFELANYWNEKNEVNKLKTFCDEETGFNRLDRHNIVDIEKKFQEYKIKIKFGVYSDFHLPRLKCYQSLIEDLVFY